MIPKGRQSPIGSPDFTAGRPNSGKGRPHLPAVKRVRGMRQHAPPLHDAPDSMGRGHRLLTPRNTPQNPGYANGGPSSTGRAAAYLYRTSMRVYAVPPLGLEPRTQGF